MTEQEALLDGYVRHFCIPDELRAHVDAIVPFLDNIVSEASVSDGQILADWLTDHELGVLGLRVRRASSSAHVDKWRQYLKDYRGDRSQGYMGHQSGRERISQTNSCVCYQLVHVYFPWYWEATRRRLGEQDRRNVLGAVPLYVPQLRYIIRNAVGDDYFVPVKGVYRARAEVAYGGRDRVVQLPV